MILLLHLCILLVRLDVEENLVKLPCFVAAVVDFAFRLCLDVDVSVCTSQDSLGVTSCTNGGGTWCPLHLQLLNVLALVLMMHVAVSIAS